MSWLARSFANSLRLEDDDDGGKSGDDDEEDNDVAPVQPNDLPPQGLLLSSPSSFSSTRNENNHSQPHQLQYQQRQEQQNDYQERVQRYSTLENGSLSQSLTEYELQSRGVKDDLNEFKQTLTRQFWGMANFIAPPPSNHSHIQNENDPTVFRGIQCQPQDFQYNDQESMSDALISGNRSELSEMEARLRTEVPETCRHDPNLDRLGSESERNEDSGNEEWDTGQETEVEVVGITEEVLAFAMNIAMHPETWLDFPIEEEEDTDDFQMSAAQKFHALAIERLAPRLAALRIELCPCHMSESYFWKVYFVLLHSRLNKRDAEFLSTSQVMAARAKWMQELHKQMQPPSDQFSMSTSYSKDILLHDDPHPGLLNDSYSESTPHGTYIYESTAPTMRTDFEIEKHMVETSGMHYVDKPVIVEKPVIKTDMKNMMIDQLIQECDDDNDWPEDDSDFGGTTIPIENEDDISFSDLEDDSFDKFPVKSNTVQNA